MKNKMSQTIYEYKEFSLGLDSDTTELLNQWGQLGWRVITSHVVDSPRCGPYLFVLMELAFQPLQATSDVSDDDEDDVNPAEDFDEDFGADADDDFGDEEEDV